MFLRRFSAALIVVVLASVPASGQHHEALRYGAPDTGHIIDYGTYLMSHDGRLRSARWVAERLTKESLTKHVERKDEFKPDRRIPSEFRAELSDYKSSGFDRGHQAPSENHVRSREINSATFFLTNMSPQVGTGFNQQYWKYLEITIRKHALSGDVQELYVFTGPLIMPAKAPQQGYVTGQYGKEEDEEEDGEEPLTVQYRYIGGNHIPVPTHYFKAVLVVPADQQRSVKLYTFILPNESIDSSTPLETFARSVDYLEHWAGFDLWSELPDDEEDYKESMAWEPWGPLLKR